jgi:putative tryptophan/tyrosine transport system substrate-binding protein
MKRREVVTILGGAAAAWPLAARAQQDGRMRRVAILLAYPPTDAEWQARVQALRDELAKLGWTRDRNIQFDVRWTTDNMDLVRANAANVVELKPDVIVTSGGRVVPVFMQLTRSIPIIVPGAGDPVGVGWIESLARPGGNVTGFTSSELSMFGKWLEILKQIAPATSRVAIIYNPDNPNTAFYVRMFETFARQLAIMPVIAPVHGLADIERAIESLAQQPNGAIFFAPDLTVIQLRDQITAIVARRRIPAMYTSRILVIGGGLVSYDADTTDMFRRSASYVDRVLRGEKPGELPFQQPTRYQLTINLKTAKAMGLDIPATVLATHARIALAAGSCRGTDGEPDFIAGRRAVDSLKNEFEIEAELQLTDDNQRRFVATERYEIATADLALHVEAVGLKKALHGRVKRGLSVVRVQTCNLLSSHRSTEGYFY